MARAVRPLAPGVAGAVTRTYCPSWGTPCPFHRSRPAPYRSRLSLSRMKGPAVTADPEPQGTTSASSSARRSNSRACSTSSARTPPRPGPRSPARCTTRPAALLLLPDQLREAAGRSTGHAAFRAGVPWVASRALVEELAGVRGDDSRRTCGREDVQTATRTHVVAVPAVGGQRPCLVAAHPSTPANLALSRKKLTSHSKDFLAIYTDSTRIGYRRRFLPVPVVINRLVCFDSVPRKVRSERLPLLKDVRRSQPQAPRHNLGCGAAAHSAVMPTAEFPSRAGGCNVPISG